MPGEGGGSADHNIKNTLSKNIIYTQIHQSDVDKYLVVVDGSLLCENSWYSDLRCMSCKTSAGIVLKACGIGNRLGLKTSYHHIRKNHTQ